MNGNKGDQQEASEAWDQVGKAVNQATELYFKELEAYLEWAGNVRREVFAQALATSQQLSRIGEEQYAFLTRLQKNFPFFGVIPAWTDTSQTARGSAAARSGRTA